MPGSEADNLRITNHELFTQDSDEILMEFGGLSHIRYSGIVQGCYSTAILTSSHHT